MYVVASLVSCNVLGIRIEAGFIGVSGAAAVCFDVVGYLLDVSLDSVQGCSVAGLDLNPLICYFLR